MEKGTLIQSTAFGVGHLAIRTRQMWLSVLFRGRENLTPVGTHRIKGKCDYLCLAPSSLVEKILLQLEYIEFKAKVFNRTLLRMPYSV